MTGDRADGNGQRMKTLTYDEADAPMIAAAFRLAANVALAGSNGGARGRLKEYAASVAENVPPEARFFNMEEVWSEIKMAIDKAPEFSVTRRRKGFSTDGYAEITVGSRSWRTDMGDVTVEDAERLGDALERLAPIGCVRTREMDGDAPV